MLDCARVQVLHLPEEDSESLLLRCPEFFGFTRSKTMLRGARPAARKGGRLLPRSDTLGGLMLLALIRQRRREYM